MNVEKVEVFKILKSILPDFDEVIEVPVDPVTPEIGWHSLVFLKNGFCYSGGTATSRTIARRIAFAEAIERAIVTRLIKEPSEITKWQLDSFPGTQGFAVGFEYHPTRLRSIYEGIEVAIRRTLPITTWPFEAKPQPPLSSLGTFIQSNYKTIHFYQLPLKDLIKTNLHLPPVNFLLAVLDTEWGRVAGYRVGVDSTDAWDHTLIELDRNFKNLKSVKTDNLTIHQPSIYSDLIATNNIELETLIVLPNSKLFELSVVTMEWFPSIYLSRAIFILKHTI